MASRLDLHELLCSVLGTRNVYFQPPTGLAIKYPAIVYERNSLDNRFADNIPYSQNQSYSVTVIDANPDSTLVTKVSQLPKCKFNRHFKNDNLNHDVYILYY